MGKTIAIFFNVYLESKLDSFPVLYEVKYTLTT